MRLYSNLLAGLVLLNLSWMSGCSSLMQNGCNSADDNGQCNECERSPRRWSEEWYEMKGQLPATSRQKCKHAKMWPPYPRPVGDHPACSHLFHSAHYWPHPYNCQDLAYIRQVQEQQVSNGWIDATTLYDYHFDQESHQLNQSGHLRLKWILEEVPDHRKVVFTQTGSSKEISNIRLSNVRTAAVQMVGEYNLPSIMLRITRAYGRPAVESDTIGRRYLETMPDPRISYEVQSASDTAE